MSNSSTETTETYAWRESQWDEVTEGLRHRVLRSSSDLKAWGAIARNGRRVLRSFSTSFFIVTRFLPPPVRDQVEVIYAAVRFPDEIVDSFPLTAEERIRRLDAWELEYERALAIDDLRQAVAEGIHPILAGFAHVVLRNEIPPEHYRSFLEAMRLDAAPRRFSTLDDLIDSYIYGSAIVVGYFLAHVYGPSVPGGMRGALESARALGIALQLTNFARDVAEDRRRGRLYLPLDLLLQEGLHDPDPSDPRQHLPLGRVIDRIAREAEDHYAFAHATLDAFAPDCRVAVDSCIRVYRQLNSRICSSPEAFDRRESVPIAEKLRVLPASKYWRLPLAWLTA